MGPTAKSLTTDANELASEVHNRMPVILDADDYDAWLAGEEVPLVPFDAGRMTARPISTTINNVKNQGSQCVEPRDGWNGRAEPAARRAASSRWRTERARKQ